MGKVVSLYLEMTNMKKNRCPSVRPSVCPPVRPSVCPSVCPMDILSNLKPILVEIGCVDRELEFFKSAEVSLLGCTEIDDYFFVHM